MRLHRINNVVSVIVGECVENLECKCVRVVGTLFKICGAVTVEVFSEPFPVEDINTNGFVVLDEDTDID